MGRRRVAVLFATTVTAVLGLFLSTAQPAGAGTTQDRLAVLANWTQTSAASYGAWYIADGNQSTWTAYAFDWTTDYCSVSPDRPLGFDFAMSCARHDFGYRNYRAAGQFSTNKSRVDKALRADLLRVCATYEFLLRPACRSLAWTYYEAVHLFGSFAVSATDVAHAARLLPAGTSAADVGSANRTNAASSTRRNLFESLRLAL